MEPRWPFAQMFVLWVVGTFLLLSPIPILMGLNQAFAFGDNSYGYEEVRAKESLKRPKAYVKPEPVVQVERYNEQDLRNDESVLISGKRVVTPPPPDIKKEIHKTVKQKPQEMIVTSIFDDWKVTD